MATNQELAEKVEQGPAEVEKKDMVRELLIRHQKQFELALAGNVDGDKFVRVALTEIRRTPKLAECSQASLLGALMSLAAVGLEPGGPLGHAYLVPFKGEVVPIIGYKGFEQLAYRSGLVASINARVRREGDTFDFEFGTNEYIRHIPKAGVGGEVTHAYAIAKLVTGGSVNVVLFKEDIERRRKASPSGGSEKSPWATDYDQMARKSAIRALFNDLPASTEIQRALGYDERTVQVSEVEQDVIDVEGEEV